MLQKQETVFGQKNIAPFGQILLLPSQTPTTYLAFKIP